MWRASLLLAHKRVPDHDLLMRVSNDNFSWSVYAGEFIEVGEFPYCSSIGEFHIATTLCDNMQKSSWRRVVDGDIPTSIGRIGLLDKLYELCCVERSSNASIATKNGGVELLTSLCDFLHCRSSKPLVSALRTLSSIIHVAYLNVDELLMEIIDGQREGMGDRPELVV
ncbi:hypothetical protein KSP40_PGU000938 [Platanthera guangdongensis]|uniref:Uncharacterized protein n=1 Tax=Platanthera guangdongensis TaxID=2320717 RepID=A0ABR2LZC9_9ASPA